MAGAACPMCRVCVGDALLIYPDGSPECMICYGGTGCGQRRGIFFLVRCQFVALECGHTMCEECWTSPTGFAGSVRRPGQINGVGKGKGKGKDLPLRPPPFVPPLQQPFPPWSAGPGPGRGVRACGEGLLGVSRRHRLAPAARDNLRNEDERGQRRRVGSRSRSRSPIHRRGVDSRSPIHRRRVDFRSSIRSPIYSPFPSANQPTASKGRGKGVQDEALTWV